MQIEKIKNKFTAMGIASVPLLVLVSVVLNIPLVIVALIKSKGQQNVLFTGSTLFIALILTILAELITILIALAVVKGLKEWRQLLLVEKSSWKQIGIGVGIGALLFIGLQLISILLVSLGVSIENSETSEALSNLSGVYGILTLVLFVPFIVPMVEELFFRGYVLNFIRLGRGSEKTRTILAVVISSLYFSIMHFQGFSSINDVLVVFWTGMIGVINALLVIKYRSIFPAIAVHVSYNGISAFLMLLSM